MIAQLGLLLGSWLKTEVSFSIPESSINIFKCLNWPWNPNKAPLPEGKTSGLHNRTNLQIGPRPRMYGVRTPLFTACTGTNLPDKSLFLHAWTAWKGKLIHASYLMWQLRM
jgi:hypothetical protein